jgi:hypothetical protein
MGQAKRRQKEIEALKAATPGEKPKSTTGLASHRLYHGTTETVARLILDNGEDLKPRGERPSVYDEEPSRSDCVYLTHLYGVKYAFDTVWNEWAGKEIDVWNLAGAVIEIDINRLTPSDMLPDEDFMAKAHMAVEGLTSREDFTRLTQHYAQQQHAEPTVAGQLPWWKLSVLSYGTVAYRGCVPRSAMTRIALISAQGLAVLRHKLFPGDENWKIHPTPLPEALKGVLTATQQLQASITHGVFDISQADIQVIRMRSAQ